MADITTLLDLLNQTKISGQPILGPAAMPGQAMPPRQMGQQPNDLARMLMMDQIPRGAVMNDPQMLNQLIAARSQDMGGGGNLWGLLLSLMGGRGGSGLLDRIAGKFGGNQPPISSPGQAAGVRTYGEARAKDYDDYVQEQLRQIEAGNVRPRR